MSRKKIQPENPSKTEALQPAPGISRLGAPAPAPAMGAAPANECLEGAPAPPALAGPAQKSVLPGTQAALPQTGSGDDGLRRELEEATRKSNEHLCLLQKVAAEFDNYRKFTDRSRAEAVLCERALLLMQFIDVMENLERAIDAGKKTLAADNPLMKGLSLTLNITKELLGKEGVKPIEALGKQFNPELHEAVYFVPDPGRPEYAVAEELLRGYTLGTRVLRISKVSVVSRPGESISEDEKKSS